MAYPKDFDWALAKGSDEVETVVDASDGDGDDLLLGVVEGEYDSLDEGLGDGLSDGFRVGLNEGNDAVGGVEEGDAEPIRLGVVVILFAGFCDTDIVGLELGIMLELGLVV